MLFDQGIHGDIFPFIPQRTPAPLLLRLVGDHPPRSMTSTPPPRRWEPLPYRTGLQHAAKWKPMSQSQRQSRLRRTYKTSAEYSISQDSAWKNKTQQKTQSQKYPKLPFPGLTLELRKDRVCCLMEARTFTVRKERDVPEHMMLEGFRWSIGNLLYVSGK